LLLIATANSLVASIAWIETRSAAEESIFKAKMVPTAAVPRATTNFQSIKTVKFIAHTSFQALKPRIYIGGYIVALSNVSTGLL
jgi:hypothetical protein